MSGKNFGPAVSGYLIPTGRNWETAVFQAGKPVLDKELNLEQDIDGGQAETDLQRDMPSGWISDDFLSTSDPTAGFFVFNPASLTLQLVQPATGLPKPNGSPPYSQGLVAHVNGWLLNIQHTGVINTNTLTLTAGPSGNGSTRTDLVIVEVWRRLLSAAPTPNGKSALGNIWQYGNVKTDPANDSSLNFPDDIKDTNVGAETTKRVQIQFRLRVIPGVDLFTNPYGIDDPTVVANTVPATAVAPDGTPSIEAFAYSNQSAAGDPGLWLAGDGNPANSLGTVDGYMYAIPLMGIFRRNTSAWDRLANQNGGAATPGPSTRPDGYFTDVIEARDIVDLRLGVSPTGWDLDEVLTKNFNYLLDNNLHSEWTSNTFGGAGINGATLPWADEIGPLPSDGAGPLIGSFDGGRRFFSDRAILETITVEIPAPGGGWTNGSVVTIDPTALPIYPYAAFNWAALAPSNVVFMDIKDAWWIGSTAPKKTLDALAYFQSVTNLGAITVTSMTVTIGTITGLGLTNESLFVDLVVAYPTGVGLTKTPVAEYGANSFALTGGTMPVGAPVSFSAYANQTIDETHREVQLQYTTVSLTITQSANTDLGNAGAVSAVVGTTATITGLTGMYPALVGQFFICNGATNAGNNNITTGWTITAVLSPTSIQVTNATAVSPDSYTFWEIRTSFFRLPERAATIVSVTKNSVAIAGTVTLDTTGRYGTFTNPTDYTVSGDVLQITYTAIRPMPSDDTGLGALEQMTIYYDTRAPQPARQALLSTLQVIPKYIPNQLCVLTVGAGSQDEAYPWPQGYVQTGGIFPSTSASYNGESDLSGRAAIAVTEFNASTGFLNLPIYVPMVANPEQLTFTGVNTDIEGRSYFNAIPGGTYIPNAYAQDLSSAQRHKNILPMLCELAADSPLGFRGQLVLLMLVRYALFDGNNSVVFNSDETVNTTVASVVRLKGNLLNKRAI
jgi:hypothetical protein